MGESAHSRLLRKFLFSLLLGFSCDVTSVEKSFETGKRRVSPGFAQVLGSNEPSVTLPG